MPSPLQIGLLEFGHRGEGRSSMHAILDVLELARHADRLGFSRFWLTEHHLYNALAPWSSPRVFLPLLLQQTDRINVGVAGVLMNFHSPYRVATDFKLLANLFPGRCDLGFANGRPSPVVGRALRCEPFGAYPNDFHERVAEVNRYLSEEASLMREKQIVLPPAFGQLPDRYWLGSSFRHYETAAAGGMHMVKSTFHALDSLSFEEYDVVARFRDRFREHNGYEGRAVLALAGSCVPDERTRVRVWEQMKKNNQGHTIVNAIVDTPDNFHERVSTLSTRFGIREVVIREVGSESTQMLESTQLMAGVFDLGNRAGQPQSATSLSVTHPS